MTSLEKDALDIKLGVQRAEVQNHLNEKRDLLEGLEERRKSLQESITYDFSNDGDDDGSSEGENLLASITDMSNESINSSNQQSEISPFEMHGEGFDTSSQQLTPQPTPQSLSWPIAVNNQQQRSQAPTTPAITTAMQDTQTTPSLRARTRNKKENGLESTAISSSRYSAARQPSTAAIPDVGSLENSPAVAVSTAEELALRERQIQESISESLLQMARQLKVSTQGIGLSLEEDREVLEKASSNMDKTHDSMENTQGRLRNLKALQSGGSGTWLLGGQHGLLGGWMWEWKMYAIIAILWVVLILVVFVGPKIRF